MGRQQVPGPNRPDDGWRHHVEIVPAQRTFCGIYATKRFRTRTEDEIRADIEGVRATIGTGVRRVFLADGDAMCLSARRVTAILGLLNGAFPKPQRAGIYANARDVLSKTDAELVELRSRAAVKATRGEPGCRARFLSLRRVFRPVRMPWQCRVRLSGRGDDAHAAAHANARAVPRRSSL